MTMTLETSGSELLKTDCLGRVRTSRARREAILDEFERSGGSGQQFAALLGIKYPTFAIWIQSRRRARRLAENLPETMERISAPASAWLEAVLEKEPPDGERQLGSGRNGTGLSSFRVFWFLIA